MASLPPRGDLLRQLDIHVVGFEKPTDEVVAGLQRHFGLPRSAAVRFVSSVPRVARHCAGYAEAKAYEQALRAVGAVVQLRPAVSLAPAQDYEVPSLPAPPMARSKQPGYDSSATLAERIPRAPAVPAEAWHKPPTDGFDELGNPLGAPAVVRDDQALTGEFFSDNPMSSAPAAVSSAREDLRYQLRDSMSVGPQAAASSAGSPAYVSEAASGRAGVTSGVRTLPPSSDIRPRKGLGLLGVLIALTFAALGLWYFRVASSEGAQLERQAEHAGLELGEHEPAAAFLARGSIAGLSNERARDLVSAAKITGARAVQAIQISSTGDTDVANALLVELPDDLEKRSALLWLQARAANSDTRLSDDHGQRFLVITGPQRPQAGQ